MVFLHSDAASESIGTTDSLSRVKKSLNLNLNSLIDSHMTVYQSKLFLNNVRAAYLFYCC